MSYWPLGQPDIEISRSRWLTGLSLIASGLAAAGLLLSNGSPLLRFLLLMALFWSFGRSLLMTRRRVCRVRYKADAMPPDSAHGSDWVLCFSDGSEQRAELMPSSRVLPGLLALRFRASDGPRPATHELVLLPDTMSQDDWRRLQVFLKWF